MDPEIGSFLPPPLAALSHRRSSAPNFVSTAIPSLRFSVLKSSHVTASPRKCSADNSHTMQRNAPLRDPYAPEEEEQPYSGAGGPLPRLPRSGPAPLLRHTTEALTSSSFRSLPSHDSVPGSSRPNVSLGALHSSISRQDPNDAASADPSAAPRSLGLSLGLPRNRMAARSGNNDALSGISANVPIAANQADEAVRNTDSDALLSRLSALKLGYLPPEPYTQEFSTSSHSDYGAPLSRSDQSNTQARRSPLINIGTYLRCTTIDSEVEAFLKKRDTPKQIISIGAGSDSRYWRIMVGACSPKIRPRH